MSSTCNNIPVELILATTDPLLFDATNQKWLWNGQLYWAVECLPTLQTTLADRIVPRVDPSKYLPIKSNPTMWNYCISNNCNSASETMQVIFTFDPNSNNPNDYLQYVLNINYDITDQPKHSITDLQGNKLYLNITEISKMVKEPYVEIWIERSTRDSQLTIPDLNTALSHSPIPSPSPSKNNNWLMISIIIIVSLIVLILLIVGGVLLFGDKKGAEATLQVY